MLLSLWGQGVPCNKNCIINNERVVFEWLRKWLRELPRRRASVLDPPWTWRLGVLMVRFASYCGCQKSNRFSYDRSLRGALIKNQTNNVDHEAFQLQLTLCPSVVGTTLTGFCGGAAAPSCLSTTRADSANKQQQERQR